MKRVLAFLLLAALFAPAQDLGGRDRGTGPNPVLFVRWKESPESEEIYHSAWVALEPHYGVLTRRRLLTFDGSAEKARKIFEAHKDAALVVAFDARAAAATRKALEKAHLLEVGSGREAMVQAVADRAYFSAVLRDLLPGAKRVALFGSAAEPLPGFQVKVCSKVEEAAGCAAAWIPEESAIDARSLRNALDRMKIPLVTTSDRVPTEVATLSVRPDPTGLGLQVAAAVLGRLRDERPFRPVRIRRMRVVVDLGAAHAAGLDLVPLSALARADVVRRMP
ncbi:MAG: hypothetical protein ACYSX0_15010 [Planctomycetota bacterium]|jgi:hypothetical protein